MQTFQSQSVAPLFSTTASADGRPEYVVGGITLTLAAFATTNAIVNLPDGHPIPVGVKFIPFGAVLVENGAREYEPWNGVTQLVNSKTIIMDRTITSEDPRFDSPPGACNGGTFYEARLKALVGGVWTPLDADQLAALVAAQPRIIRKRLS